MLFDGLFEVCIWKKIDENAEFVKTKVINKEIKSIYPSGSMFIFKTAVVM